MIKKALLIACLAFGMAVIAPAQEGASKVGIIHIQNALLSTAEGQQAAKELQEKFEPTRKHLEGLRDEINSLQAELSRGSNTMGEERRRQLARDIDEKTRALNRTTEDAQLEFQQEQDKVLQELGNKMMAVIGRYSRDNGFSLILDVSNPQTPVLYADNSIDITQDIIQLYDAEAKKLSEAVKEQAATPQP